MGRIEENILELRDKARNDQEAMQQLHQLEYGGRVVDDDPLVDDPDEEPEGDDTLLPSERLFGRR